MDFNEKEQAMINEIKGQINDLKTQMQNASEEDKTALKAEIAILKQELKAVNDDVIAQKSKPADNVRKSFFQVIKDALVNGGHTETVTDSDGVTRQRVKGLDAERSQITVKAAVDMNTANMLNPGTGVNIGYLTDYSGKRQELPLSTNKHLAEVFPVRPTTDKYFGVVIEGTETDGSGIKAEDTAAGQSSYVLTTKEYKVFDFASIFRIHQNTLDDVEGVAARIAQIGTDRIMSTLDVAALRTTGDNAATPYGLRTSGYFTAYDTTLRAGEIANANIVDAIKNGILQAANADKFVDTVILHRNDVAEIETLKDANYNSIAMAGIKLNERGELAYIYGLQVVINNKVTANTAILCSSMESLEFGARAGVSISMNYDQSADFSKGIVSIKLLTRMAIGLGAPLSIIYISSLSAAVTALKPA